MPSLQIRNLPDDLYQALAFRAERAHRSLAQQAIIELRGSEEGMGSRRRERTLQAIRRSIEQHGPQSTSSLPEDLIRDDRGR